MNYTVDLTPQVEEALAGLSERGHHEIMESIAAMLVHPEAWPPGGVGAAWFGPCSWVLFTAYPDGIEVYDLGWLG
ncbi:hypothetical protein [Streptomyces chartreusis]|uniref:hypothetical protein n=1 Tax=Streptomyces chartreusis TaxID=1969 RepID=UPI00362E997A